MAVAPSYLKVSQIGSLGHSEPFGITYSIQREEGGRLATPASKCLRKAVWGHSEPFRVYYSNHRGGWPLPPPCLKVSCKSNLSKLFKHCKNIFVVSVSYIVITSFTMVSLALQGFCLLLIEAGFLLLSMCLNVQTM